MTRAHCRRALLLGLRFGLSRRAVSRRLPQQVDDLPVEAAVFNAGLFLHRGVQVLRDTNGDANFSLHGAIVTHYDATPFRCYNSGRVVIPVGGLPMGARPVEYEVTESGCHVVTSHKPGVGGYVSAVVEGRKQRLHRWSWERANGETIRPGLMVLHSCDNPPCINPVHLRPGVAVQNTDDAIQRGRHVYGSRCGNAVLTEAMVYEARVKRMRGVPRAVIGQDMPGSWGAIDSALNGKTWRHVPFPDADGNPLPIVNDWRHVEDIATAARDSQ